MGLFSSIYTGLSGLVAFSKGLNVISNNVTNINTPGFRGSDILFRDLLYKQGIGVNTDTEGQEQIGQGVATRDTRLRTTPGDIQETRGQTDAAINGNGFFLLRDQSNTFLTRVGQFEFNDDGILVDSASGLSVVALNSGAAQGNIDIGDFRISPPTATTEILLENNLSTGSTDHTIDNVEVVDANGGRQVLEIRFINNASVLAGSWLVEVRDATGAVIDSGDEVRFQANGTPASAFNTVEFTLSPANTPASQITINLGDPGAFGAVTSFSSGSTSNTAVRSQDGVALGSVLNVAIAVNGEVVANYTNGETATIGQIALASVATDADLQPVRDALFTVADFSALEIGEGGSVGFGQILGGSIEASNVELSEEFTDLIIVQRGFQSSSQVLSVSNEMVEQLLEMDSRR
ncbi:MAG: flagellar hook-basal body complex protein [Pseudomonadota bacterium]